jgi:hypothetical protein
MWSFSSKGAFPVTSFPAISFTATSFTATQGIWTKNLRQWRILVTFEPIDAATQVLMPFFLRRDKHQPDVQGETSGLPYLRAGKILR